MPANEADLKAPSVASSSRISLDSRTSTLKYDQEPFDQYQERVKRLCHRVWPQEVQVQSHRGTVSGGGATALILDAVRLKKWRRTRSHTSKDEFIVERLDGGTYNRVIGIKTSGLRTKEPRNVILRVPRANMAEFSNIEREVAILQFVSPKTTLPVAEIITFDPTDNNPLDSGYVVQSRLPGVALHTIWDNLTHTQCCTIAKDVGKILLSLQEGENSFPGLIEASPKHDAGVDLIVRPFDIVSSHDVDWKQKLSIKPSTTEVDTTKEGSLQWFKTQFGRWFAHELIEDPSAILYWDYQYLFLEVAKQLNGFGFLGDGQNCLCHFDIAARNLMVQISTEGFPEISGVVDWDSAVFAPIYASCVPPFWLWNNPGHYDEEGRENEEPSTAEQKDIKEVFDDTVSFDWTWFEYGPAG